MYVRHDALVLPLWIDGHPFLTMVQEFCDVRDASGKLLRRTPLTGAGEAQAAADAARRALAAWQPLAAEARSKLLAAAADALDGYAAHFAGLIGEETGFAADAAAAEVAAAVAALRAAASDCRSGEAPAVLALVAGRDSPLAAPLARALAALAAGATVVVKPSPHAPSALFALAEVLAEAGFPGGVFNIVHGDEASVDGLCAASGIDAIACVGDTKLVERVAAIAARQQRKFLAP
ncbi:aldehyde dehydrogenase family protein [Rhodocyclus purpureus]|uniref:aldehyde dehydrogenase family protein n=1 Tax=Rhodocyclus purpureus TaxID=1067 RepID=UPI0019115C79|nr:aldehyde dehydrogenase family protein [Rhodocyclus purpureus]MBK5914419.1 hypothetical protein [Rhodocyclus purpureus]